MVYRGPSSGCKTCRRRRVKCDENKPNCGNCAKLNITCLGYADLFDKRHRDETRKVERRNCTSVMTTSPRQHSRVSIRQRNSSLGRSCSKDSTSVRKLPSKSVSSISPSLPLDPEMASLDFFFLAYGSGRDRDATCSLLEILPELHAICHSESPLMLATAALAIKVTGLWRLRDPDPLAARQRYVQAVASAKEAIKSPTRSTSDELLMTTLVLGTYDGLASIYQGRPRTSVHFAGALALIKHRGQLNYRDDISQRMILAARNMFAQDAPNSPIMMADPGFLWQIGGFMPQSPAMEVDRLAYRLSELSRRISSGNGTHEIGDPEHSLSCEVAALANECIAWTQGLPQHWQPLELDAQTIERLNGSPGICGKWCHLYADFSVACLWNRHRLIELRIYQLLKLCHKSHSPGPHQTTNPASRVQIIVDEICASVPYHLGDVMETARFIAKPGAHLPHLHGVDVSSSWAETLSRCISQHERQIASSGAMSIYQVLSAITTLGRNVDDNSDLMLSKGQMDWIMRQVSRLQALLNIPLLQVD